jgi:hypothetical protein
VVTTARTDRVPRAATFRCRQSVWFWNVLDTATSTSGACPGGASHDSPSAQDGSSRIGPTYRTLTGSFAGKSNAALVEFEQHEVAVAMESGAAVGHCAVSGSYGLGNSVGENSLWPRASR